MESAREQDIQYVQQEDVQQTIIADQTTQVVTSHTGGINIIGQDDTGNPIDIHLVCKLLFSSQSQSFDILPNEKDTATDMIDQAVNSMDNLNLIFLLSSYIVFSYFLLLKLCIAYCVQCGIAGP